MLGSTISARAHRPRHRRLDDMKAFSSKVHITRPCPYASHLSKQEFGRYHWLVGVAVPYPLPDEGWQGARLQCRLLLCQDISSRWPLCWVCTHKIAAQRIAHLTAL